MTSSPTSTDGVMSVVAPTLSHVTLTRAEAPKQAWDPSTGNGREAPPRPDPVTIGTTGGSIISPLLKTSPDGVPAIGWRDLAESFLNKLDGQARTIEART